MKLPFCRACILLILILSFGNSTFLQAAPPSQIHQWIQILEDKQNVQDSVISMMSLEISALQQQIDSLSQKKISLPAEEKKAVNINAAPVRKDSGISNLLLFLIAGLAGLLAIAVSVFVPFYFFRENHRLRDEVHGLMIELQRVKSLSGIQKSGGSSDSEVTPKYEQPQQPVSSVFSGPEPEYSKPQSPDYLPKKERELSTVEFITRLELCIIANQEDEFNHVVAEMVQATAAKETTTLLRFLHRVAACVFRGRMPAQAPVMAEVQQFLWSCDTPVYYQTEKIVSWARSSTRLSDAQRAYIFSISSELDRMLAEHNRQFNT